MHPDHPGRSAALFRLAPPYTRFEELPDLDASEMPDLPLGSVVVVELTDPAEWPAVEAVAPRLRARFPAAPLALRIRSGVGIDPVDAARRAAPFHIRAVLGDDAPPRETLQTVLDGPRQSHPRAGRLACGARRGPTGAPPEPHSRHLPAGAVPSAAPRAAPVPGPARTHGAQLVPACGTPRTWRLAGRGARRLRRASAPARAADLAAHDRSGVRLQRSLLAQPPGRSALRCSPRRDSPDSRMGRLARPVAGPRRRGCGIARPAYRRSSRPLARG